LFKSSLRQSRKPQYCRFAAVVGAAKAAIIDNLQPFGACAPPTKSALFDADEILDRRLKPVQNLEKAICRPGERRDPAFDLVVRGGCLSTIKGWVPV
jgi:hypothetical protein